MNDAPAPNGIDGGPAVPPRDFACVVAMDAARGIGRAGDLPWPPLKADMQHFARLTTTAAPGRQNAVIMGRKTWASLPAKYQPLPRRHNIVISRRLRALPGGAHVATSLAQALALAAALPACDQLFVIGGGQIYAEALAHPACAYVYLSELDATFACDTTLPPLVGFEPDPSWPAQLHQEAGLTVRIARWRRLGTNTPPPAPS